MNKKGFTLVELLAVIVILAVVMLIGGTTVLPMMQKAQKSSLGTEAVSMKKAAENAFQTELIKGANAAFNSTDKVCFTMQYLCKTGAFDKGCKTVSESGSDKYAGAVLVDPTATPTEYTMWITNNTYSFGNATVGLKEADITNPDKATSDTVGNSECGSSFAIATNKAKCSVVSGTAKCCKKDASGAQVCK